METNTALACSDAALSAISLACAIAGVAAIRRKDVPRHRRWMLYALASSTLFMILFVIRFVTFGFQPFAGHGTGKTLYTILLFTHEPLAVINVPLVLAAAGLALLRRFDLHREVAPMAFWIWTVVLATGIAVFLALYA